MGGKKEENEKGREERGMREMRLHKQAFLELIYKLYRCASTEVYSPIHPPQEPGYEASIILHTVPVFPFGWTVDMRQHCPSWPHPFPL